MIMIIIRRSLGWIVRSTFSIFLLVVVVVVVDVLVVSRRNSKQNESLSHASCSHLRRGIGRLRLSVCGRSFQQL
jgi:hypothetical protein